MLQLSKQSIHYVDYLSTFKHKINRLGKPFQKAYERRRIHSNLCSVIHCQARCLNMDSDYGKFSDPNISGSFFEWATNTSGVQFVEKYFITIHDVTGLHWCSSIVISTILLRCIITTPLYIAQVKNNIKYQMYLPIFADLFKKLTEETNETAKQKNWDDKTTRNVFLSNLLMHRKKIKNQYKIPGIGKRFFLPFVQIPLWVSVSISLRHLAGSLAINTVRTSDLETIGLQLSQEGCLWFSNLCHVDSYYVLPIALGIVNLSIIEIYRGDGKIKPVGMQKFLLMLSRTLSIILVPVACQMPTAVVLYWFSSSMYGASQALLFRSHKVKRFFRIPFSKNESQTPYKDLFKRLSLKRHRTDI